MNATKKKRKKNEKKILRRNRKLMKKKHKNQTNILEFEFTLNVNRISYCNYIYKYELYAQHCPDHAIEEIEIKKKNFCLDFFFF